MSSHQTIKRLTVPDILNRKKNGPKITMLTAYDFPMATVLDEAGIDMILVGDSLGNVIYGHENTLSVTMDDMVRHTSAVVNGAKRSLVVADMPFMSYQDSVTSAVQNAGRLIKESKAHGVKLEGGKDYQETIYRIVGSGIPVVAHIGLLPQQINSLGSYRMHGKSDEECERIKLDALSVQEAGAFCVVLECVETELARDITESLDIPTIGIGSGLVCDGEVLVSYDLLGMGSAKVPKFVNPTAQLRELMSDGVKKFISRTQGE